LLRFIYLAVHVANDCLLCVIGIFFDFVLARPRIQTRTNLCALAVNANKESK